MSFKFTESTKTLIKKHTGKSVSELQDMSACDIDRYIEKKQNIKLEVKNYQHPALIGRGSIYLSLDRILTFKNIKKYL
jgi:hypothetical protein